MTAQRVFSRYDQESYEYRFQVTLDVGVLVGGVPSDPKVAEGWLRSKLQESDDRIREMVAEVMVEREVDAETAAKIVNEMKNLNGFKRTPDGVLFIEGRQVKAALKEAASIAVSAGKVQMIGWGSTRKWLTKFLPEHVFVIEETIPVFQRFPLDDGSEDEFSYVPVTAATGINQQFVHTHRGSSIQYQEFIRDAVVKFTVITDHNFTTKDWGMIWTTGERNGLGASRSQGYGTYAVTAWEAVENPWTKAKAKKEAKGANED